jgi:pimeloyl-ACP methyl ester carboxylesterase
MPYKRAVLVGMTAVSAALLLATSPPLAAAETAVPGFSERFADVNGVRLHYLIGGKGSPVVLLHGYAQTGLMWRPIMPLLAERHTVIVPDLRGAGGSSKPEGGYDKKNMAVDIHELTSSLGFNRVSIVGHDIGLMVAYAYAAQFHQATDRLVLMDAFLPGIGNWKDVWLMRDLWHFHFYGEVPLALVKGRERVYFEHFWNDFAADPKHSVSEADRQLYAEAYAQPGGMRAGFEYFRNFERDAQDFAQLSATRLAMPVLVLTGEKASGQFLIEQARLVATNVKGVVIEGSGHWLIDEAPAQVIPQLVAFLDEARTAGGDTRIEAHEHPDDRAATVISGTWYFGYGDRFEENGLKPLPPGSFYTEAPNAPHFARTGSTPVVLQITGFGPTGTRYTNSPPTASSDR